MQAQTVWGDGVVKIGSLMDDRAACESFTKGFIAKQYAFESGPVLFKPTKTSQIQFRGTAKGAVSYFIAGDADFPEDGGFAIQPWTNVRFENSDMILGEDRAIAMGNYFFTDLSGGETKVEYTFGYKLSSAGELLIDVHHSSLPYSPVVS